MKKEKIDEMKGKEERMLHIRLPAAVHKSLRIRAAELDTTVQKLVAEIIVNGLEIQKEGK
jgi:plasmid stability protein